ncbi:MAG: hypothetical protein CMJ76_14850 [Planctomycetaceae bacterium]|nr:hypothetical protein [Planctomycetaceae bacterium]|tara:strand:+ start:285 stop:1298 length:1014 start_codon:yes stop_codon:yes gene_type:complete
MSKRVVSENGIGGLDSFQDIVANLVGILIILVMVVMMRTRNELAQNPQVPPAEKVTQAEVEEARVVAMRVEDNVLELDDTVQRQEFELDYRKRERDRILEAITLAEQEFKTQQESLSVESQAEIEMASKYQAMSKELGELIRSRQILNQLKPDVHVIEHMPTPMAKTVFGKEIHFRLDDGRISYVPFDELVDRMKRDAQSKVYKLHNHPRITETIGPVSGYRLRYDLGYTNDVVKTRTGPRLQQKIEMLQLELIPVQSVLGEPVTEALADGSQFMQYIKRTVPDTTTVTIWVYPNSFDQFRKFKTTLFSMGYACAGRPLPEGLYISASPHGTKSVRQ